MRARTGLRGEQHLYAGRYPKPPLVLVGRTFDFWVGAPAGVRGERHRAGTDGAQEAEEAAEPGGHLSNQHQCAFYAPGGWRGKHKGRNWRGIQKTPVSPTIGILAHFNTL